MKELIIYEFQAKEIENTLRLVANAMGSHKKESCLDRDIMQCWNVISNILGGNPNQHVVR